MISKPVIYIDPQGKENNALVTAVNPLHAHAIDLVYVREDGAVVHKFGILHQDHESKDETNSELPRIAVNAWKFSDLDKELQRAADKNAVKAGDAKLEDQPTATVTFPAPDGASEPPVKAEITAFRDGEPSAEDLDAVAQEQKAADATIQ